MSRHPRPIRSPEKILSGKLQPGEEILWTAHPEERLWTWTVVKRLLQGCVLLAVFITGIRWVWSHSGLAFLFLLLVSLPVSYVLLIFLINFLAAPWLERPRRRNSLYAVTNRRLITIIKPSTLFITETVRTYPIRKLKYVHQKLHRDGTGHLILGYSRRRRFIIKDVPQPGEVADLLKNRIRKGITPS